MNRRGIVRAVQLLGTGAVLLQLGGCNLMALNEFVQTILLGITAAGSIAILNNI